MNNYSKELMHHGVQGMHWGIRRYQPYPDGYNGEGKFIGKKSEMRNLKREIRELKDYGTDYSYGEEYSKKKSEKYQKKIDKAEEKGKPEKKIQKLKFKKEVQDTVSKLLAEAHDKKLSDVKERIAAYNQNADKFGKKKQDLRTLTNEKGESLRDRNKFERRFATVFGGLWGGGLGTILSVPTSVALAINPLSLAVPAAALTGIGASVLFNRATSDKSFGKDRARLAKMYVKEENKKYKPEINADKMDEYIKKKIAERNAAATGYGAGYGVGYGAGSY